MKNRNKKQILIIVILLCALWCSGTFNRFNFFTGFFDTRFGITRYILFKPEPKIDYVAFRGLGEKFHLYEINKNPNVSFDKKIGIRFYNFWADLYLQKQNGKNWKAKYNKEIELYIKEYSKH